MLYLFACAHSWANSGKLAIIIPIGPHHSSFKKGDSILSMTHDKSAWTAIWSNLAHFAYCQSCTQIQEDSRRCHRQRNLHTGRSTLSPKPTMIVAKNAKTTYITESITRKKFRAGVQRSVMLTARAIRPPKIAAARPTRACV